MKMSSVENLFVQIFERKKWIIEQVKRQTDLYDKHLASKLIIEGINPPPWLLNTHQSSNPRELNKEELISEILPPPPRLPTVHYPSARCSLHKPVVADDSADVSLGTSLEVSTSNKSFYPKDGITTASLDLDNNKEFALNSVPEFDVSVNSPLDQADVPNNFNDLDLSLARLKRSKSRQKALQLRNSAQAEGKGSSSVQNNCDVSPIGIGLSSSDQANHNCEVHRLSEHCIVSNGGFRESAERNHEDQERGINLHAGESSKHETSTNELEYKNDFLKVDGLFDVAEKGHTQRVDNSSAAAQKIHSTHKRSCNSASTNINSSDSASQISDLYIKSDHLLESFPVGNDASKLKEFVEVHQHEGIEINRVTRSRSSANQLNSLSHSLKVDGSADVVQNDKNTQARSTGCVSGRSLEVANTADIYQPIVKGFLEINEKNGNHCGRITRSRSMAQKLPSLGDDSHASMSTFSESLSTDVFAPNIGKNGNHCSRITRSRSMAQKLPSLGDDSRTNICRFSERLSTDVFSPAIGGSSEVLCNNLDSLKPVKPSLGLDHKSTKTQCNIGDEVTIEPVDTLAIAGSGGVGSIAVVSEKSSQANYSTHCSTSSKLIFPCSDNCDADNQQGFFQAVREGTSTCSSRASNSNLKMGLELLSANPPPYCFMPMKPKQLDFDDMEECNLKKTFTPNFEEKSLKAIGEISNTSADPTSEKKISGSPVDNRFSREQATPEQEISSKLEVLENSFVSGIREPAGIEMNGHASDMNEHLESRNTVYESRGSQCSQQSAYNKTLSNDDGCHDAETSHDKLNPKESYSSMVDLQVEVGGNSCDRSAQCLPASYVASTKISDTPHVSSLTKKVAGDCQDCSAEYFETGDLTSASPDAKRQSYSPNDPNLSCFDGKNNHRDDAICFDQKNKSTLSASSSEDELRRVSRVPFLFREPAEEERGTGKQNELLSSAKRFSDEQDIPDLLHLEKKIKLDILDDLTCLERNSHAGEKSIYSQSFVCCSPQNKDSDIIDADQSKPVLESFIIDTPAADRETDLAKLGVNYDNLDFPRTSIERASILEQICKSASTHTPLPHFASAFGLHHTKNLCQSLPNGLLEYLDLRSTMFSEEDVSKQLSASYSGVDEMKDSVQEIPRFDYPPSYRCQLGWRSGSQYQSPIGKFWEKSSSHSSSSEKCLSSNPELVCFPIEEDPNSSEENEAADEVAGKFHDKFDEMVMDSQVKRLPLADISESCLNPPASVSAAERVNTRGRLDSVNADVSCTGRRDKVKRKFGSSFRNMTEAKVKKSTSTVLIGIKQGNESLKSSSRPKLSAKSSIKRETQKLSEKRTRQNIVTTVTSFIPLVQQKQAAAVCTGKRDVKVKALEAAEAAKRLEEKIENERKMRKEEMKNERARLEQENRKQLEFHKKKKEEEKRKKEADAKARKRQREEEEKNENERKKKRVEEARRLQREQQDKTHSKRVEKDKRVSTIDEKAMAKKKCNSNVEKCQTEKERAGSTFLNLESELKPADTSRNESFQATISPGTSHLSHNSTDKEKATCILEKPDSNTEHISKRSQEISYEISPYQCSDDEEDEDEDRPIRKFVPSWASKSNVANVHSLKHGIDTDSIFPPGSFCSVDEVLVPRNVQQRRVAI